MFCPACGKFLPDNSPFCSGCGKKMKAAKVEAFTPPVQNKGVEKPANGAVYSIKGNRGRHIDIYENKCVITTKTTIGSIMTYNATDGEKTIYYKDCLGVQYKKGGLLIGYLQFETASGAMNNKASNFFAENTFTFDLNQVTNEYMQEVVAYVKRRIEEIKTQGNTPLVMSNVSPAEELKKFKELLDIGVITQEEFDIKKKQLLGI